MAKRGYKLQEFIAHTSDVNCLNIGKKSSRVFVTGGEDRKVNLWAIGKPTPLLSLCGHTSAVESVAFDSAEVLVLAGSSNGIIKLWDLEEAKIVRTLSGHRFNCTSVEFHPFGEFFASGSSDTDLKIWDIRKKGCIHTYKGHTRGIQTIKFTPDGRWVVTGGEDNVVKVWDLTAGKLLHDFKFHKGQIRCIDFHPHEFLLATGSADRTVKFWDLETFELIGSAGPEVAGVRSMIFHPDGRTLFCGLDATLKVFSWEPIRCHDVVDMGWSTLGDLSIYEGKLLGCSYHESRVGVWVADISVIGPYAVGAVSKTYDLMEPVYSNGEDHSTKLMESNIKTSTALIKGHHDLGGKPKGVLQGINSTYASSMAPINSTDVKRNKNTIRHSTSQGFDPKSSSKASAVNSTAFRVVKATESPSNTPNRIESGFASRAISSCSTMISMNNPITLRKGSMMEANAVMDVQAFANPVSMPVVVPRDSLNQDTPGSSRRVIAETEAMTQGSMHCKPTQMRKPSFLGGCSESELIATGSGPLSGMSNNLGVLDPKLLSKTAVSHEAAEADEGNHRRTKSIAEKIEKIMSLEQPLQVYSDKNAEAPCSNSEINSVKYVRGVAVQLGKTRSLVESWERRERFNSGYSATTGSSSADPAHGDNTSASLLKAVEKTSERDVMSADDEFIPDILLQNHDVFINVVKSRLTKLQAVRHFWEQNGIKGAITSVAKLPDHSVQVDLIGILREKIDLFTLELFSCLLPLLVGLLNSRTERHLIVSLEMLLELVKIFGPVIHSTMSASSLVGVDLQAEQRLERCSHCFNHLEKIKQMLPSLIRRGGLLARHAQELNLFLLDL